MITTCICWHQSLYEPPSTSSNNLILSPFFATMCLFPHFSVGFAPHQVMRRTSGGDLYNSTLSFLDLAGVERPAASAKGAGKPFGGKTPAERKKEMASKKGA